MVNNYAFCVSLSKLIYIVGTMFYLLNVLSSHMHEFFFMDDDRNFSQDDVDYFLRMRALRYQGQG